MRCFFGVLLLFACTTVPVSADERTVVVGKLSLEHNGKLSSRDEQSVIKQIKGHRYNSTDLDEIAEQIRFALQEHGYFKVAVYDPTFRVIRRDGHSETLDVTVPVEEGDLYRLKAIIFSRADVFTATELRRQFRIADGDIFDRKKIANGLERLRRLYGSKGYCFFSAVPETQIDERAHTVSLMIDLDRGKIFHFGELTVQGEESVPGARDRLLAAWRSYKGKTYDYAILEQFLRDVHARPSVRPEQVFRTSLDAQAGIVNVQITLRRPYTLLSAKK